MMKNILKKKNLKSTIIKVLLLLMIAITIGLFLNIDKVLDEDKLLNILTVYKDKAILIYFLVCFAQPIFLPLPEAVTVMTGSIVFGKFTGAIVGFGGTVLGIITMFLLSRYASQKFIKGLISNEKLEKFNRYIKKNETLIIFLLFIIPILPDEIICVGTGLTAINGYRFIIIAILSKLVTAFTLAYSIELLNFSPMSITIIALMIISIIMITKFTKNKESENFN